MVGEFDKLRAELDAIRAKRNARKTVVAVRRKPSHGELVKSLQFAIENGAISSADGCRFDLLIRQGKVPESLQKALIDLHASNASPMLKAHKRSASDKDAISKVRALLDAVAAQKDVRHRLGLAHSAGVVSKAKYLHFSKILDNGGELPADISRALASIKIANADNDIGTDPQQNGY